MSASPEGRSDPVLAVRDLTLDLMGYDAQRGLVEGVTFDVHANRIVALIGESGCGKTLTAMSVLRLLPPVAKVARGEILFQGRDLLKMSARDLRRVRGDNIGMVFQDPMSSLNPTMTVGEQIIEVRRLHRDEDRTKARSRALGLLEQVGIPYPGRRIDAYPFELSGGMQQRVMIAMAIACDPQILIADEPTTALDVTIQAEILELLGRLQDERGMGVLLVTHDLGVVGDYADDVVVMYAGQIVEHAPVVDVFTRPQHPYVAALLGSMPQSAEPRIPLATVPGRVPAAGSFPTGCRFRTRCIHAVDGTCDSDGIDLVETRAGHLSRCRRVQNGTLQIGPRMEVPASG